MDEKELAIAVTDVTVRFNRASWQVNNLNCLLYTSDAADD